MKIIRQTHKRFDPDIENEIHALLAATATAATVFIFFFILLTFLESNFVDTLIRSCFIIEVSLRWLNTVCC